MVLKIIHNWIVKNWFTKEEVIRFSEFTIIGLLSFAFDIGLMWLFISLFGVHYLLGAVFAFVLTTLFNYSLNRIWSFKGTKIKPLKGYLEFFILAIINLAIIAGLLWIFVEIFNIPPLIARVIAGLMLFLSNFIINSIFIFQIFPQKNKKHF